jgi:hypothetical protein
MPLIIGDIDASIQMEGNPAGAARRAGRRERSSNDEGEADRIQEIDAERFARERRIDQRDPDRLGGR